MTKLRKQRAGQAGTLALLLIVASCGSPGGLETDVFSLSFVDGPADHVVGGPIPPFRVWVLDAFDRRATGLQGGTLTLDQIGPDGAVEAAGFATVPLSFGQGTIVPSLTLAAGTGYSVRARYKNVTAESPPFSVVAAADVVRMTNPSAGEMGVLVDGANNIGRLQDIAYRATTSDVDVGVLNSGAVTHVVAVFAPDRRPELVPVSWTSAVDTLSIALRDPVALPVTVWVISGSFANESAQMAATLAQLDEVWRRERTGVVVGDIEFMDATQLATQFEFFAIGLGAPFGPIGDGVGRAVGRFNIYVVSEVREDGELVAGFAERSGTAIAVTSSAMAQGGTRLLGHNFGHNFGLRDTPNVIGFEAQGNMMTEGQTSTALTEGQTFRAHFDRFSPLRSFRTADPFASVACAPVDATAQCPDLALRIWSEAEPAAALSPRSTAQSQRK